MLRDKGRETMGEWLKENFQHIGKKDTVDLNREFLNSNTKLFEDEKTGHKHAHGSCG